MQLFEFSKQLLLQHKKEKDALLIRQPQREAGEDAPLRITLRLSPDYDDTNLPVKTMKIGAITPNTPKRDYTLDVPREALLRRERDVSDWLGTVMEFVGCSHGMALQRSLGKVNELHERKGKDPVRANAFINPKSWETRIVQEEGKLADLPLETALREMDRLEKLTLSGWREGKKDPKLMVKNFRTSEDAEQAKELLHLILQTNGHEDRALRKAIAYSPRPDEEKFQLRLPKEYLDQARSAEMYLY